MEDSAMNESTHFALFGNPVAQSLSPLMHGAAFAKMEFLATYTAYQVNDAAEIVRTIREKRHQAGQASPSPSRKP